MAMVPSLSLGIQSPCLNCGIYDSFTLVSSMPHFHGKFATGKQCMGRKSVCEEISKNVKTTTAYGHLSSKASATSWASIGQTKDDLFTVEIEGLEKVSTYRFRSEVDGHVKVIVGKKNMNYVVYIEVSSLQLCGNQNELFLRWVMYRSDASFLVPSDVEAFEVPFMWKSDGRTGLELRFDLNQAPFYLSFLLKSTLGDGMAIRTNTMTNFVVPVGFGSGYPAPMGLSFLDDGSLNFAFFSKNAENVVLCLYEDSSSKPALEISLDPYVNRSGDIWHASWEGGGPYVSYGYRCMRDALPEKGNSISDGNVLLDPYALVVGNSLHEQHVSNLNVKHIGQLCKEPAFDWKGDVHPYIPLEKLIVYRLDVKRFTIDKSSKLPGDVAGTFYGVAEKLGHLKELGVNAILLEPISLFDKHKGPYFPLHFFSPSNLYGPSDDSISTIFAMKEMVKKMHRNGIEVLLEVVFTYTGDDAAFHDIDFSSYYGKTGPDFEARNALNCNYPIVQQMILDSLQNWVIEFHIDGFCFMDASSLMRGFYGEYLSRPSLVEAIAFDPVLSKVKIIADCWDPLDKASKEVRFPHWKRWAEINTKFCVDVRNFLRGEGLPSDLATRLCGSGDIFSDGRGPAFSFNFIARNFGLPLVDLVSFSVSELASELSWNCGEEGPTNKSSVLERRLKQIRNFLFILYVSLGVPVLNMGDECGQSSGGSRSYDDRKAFDWGALKTGFGIQTTEFISFLGSLRTRRSDLLQKRAFLKEESIDWHGSEQSEPAWEDPSSKFLAMTIKAEREDAESDPEFSEIKGDLFLAFNAADRPENVVLPPAPTGMAWFRLVDTALPFPRFFSNDGVPLLEQTPGFVTYDMKSHSCALFEAKIRE
ncbi:Glycosyl hydrolase, family 13, catalytic domain [Dillenia turbinata]|uniref:Glycosyl hydrolase, family 13, catalytic domain n=1 Tax=Dillenia turbinata TaxID=194707 RepID=A0AAN8VMG8_9MAGN